MQALLLGYYFLRSFLLRGPYHTIRLLISEVGKDELLNINTAAFKKSDSTIYFHYQGASYLVLGRIFAVLSNLAKGYAFTDIGAGRGRVLFSAEQNDFTNITGIELDEELVKTANQNIISYHFKSVSASISIVQQNALDYQYPNRPEIYFLFNPFNAEVLEKVLDRILKQNSCEIYFVYMNPIFRKEFEKKKIQEIKRIRSFLYIEAIIYKVPTHR